MDEDDDVLVVGAGPAGLTAALYLARYMRRVSVLHDGASRALRIARTHNVPGFPDGVSGFELIARMTTHAERYGTRIVETAVTAARADGGGFVLDCSDGRNRRSRALVLATGTRMNQVDLPPDVHEAALRAGVLRYCPVCDGFEHAGARIGVIGCDADGAAEALFLRTYSPDVTLMPLDHADLSREQAAQLDAAGIVVERGALAALGPAGDHIDVRLTGRAGPLRFDVIYPALGSRPRNEIAAMLGIAPGEDGCAPADAPLTTEVPGLFVAGDLVEGLDQISVAFGQGAVAATRAHNWLRAQDGHALES